MAEQLNKIKYRTFKHIQYFQPFVCLQYYNQNSLMLEMGQRLGLKLPIGSGSRDLVSARFEEIFVVEMG